MSRAGLPLLLLVVFAAAVTAAVTVAVTVVPARAQPIETTAREAILIDATTGQVLLERNADQRMPTASMSKIMTAYMVFEAIKEGRLSLDDSLLVSERAWRMGGSRMFVEVNDRVRVEDLLRGMIIQSGNDASVVLAEGLAGTEEAFAQRMTERARELGLTNSNFTNATGWPDPDHYSTARDLARLAQRLITDFPQYYAFYSEAEFQYGVSLDGQPMAPQRNRNPLLSRNMGADGLKTGYTREAGYGLTASAVRDGRRLILVINGMESARARAEEAVRLLEWGFREFDTVHMFDAGEVVETAAVWMGTLDEVPLVPEEDLAITLRRTGLDGLQVVVRVEEPVPAPIPAGTSVATLVISAPDMPVREVPLMAGADVERRGFLGRMAGTLGHLVFGWM